MPEPPPAKELLFIEDNYTVRELLSEALREAGYSVIEVSRAAMALQLLRRWTPDLILVDLGMPSGEMSGEEMLAQLQEGITRERMPVVVLSGFGDVVNPGVMRRLGVCAVLEKSATSGRALVRVIQDILRQTADQTDSGP